MISKILRADSFYHTCRYICQKQGAEITLAEGVRGHNYKLMADDFLRQAQLRPSKHKACFHAILSFYPGEKPSDDTMKQITQKYLQELGIVNTQVAIAKHTDKAHLHLHIAANMINNNGKTINDSWIGLRGKKIAQELTIQYNLKQAFSKDLSLTHVESLNRQETSRYKIYVAIAEYLPLCVSMKQLEAMLKMRGIEMQYKYKGQTAEKQGVSFKIGNDCFKGSAIDRKYSLGNLNKRIAAQKEIKLNEHLTDESKINRIQNHHPVQKETKDQAAFYPGASLKDVIKENLEILLKAESTQDDLPYEIRNQKKKKRKGYHPH